MNDCTPDNYDHGHVYPTYAGIRGSTRVEGRGQESRLKRRGLHPRFDAAEVRAWYEAGLWSKNTLAYYVDRNAEISPSELGIADETTELTFAECRDQAWALAGSLAAMGLDDESVVSIQLPNVVEAVITYYALCRLGCVIVPRMMIYRESELRDAIDRTNANTFITVDNHRAFDHGAMALNLAQLCPSLQHVVLLGDAPTGTSSLEVLIETGDPYDGLLPPPDDDQIIIFTSGTTALPKGALHSFNSHSATARVLNLEMELKVGDRCFMPSPVMHNTGLNAGVISPCIGGFGTVLQDAWDAEVAIELVARFGCTHTMGATPFATMMADASESGGHDISGFRMFGCGGAPIPAAVVHRAEDALGIKMLAIFGQSEFGVETMTKLTDPVERVAASDGCAVAFNDVRILDDGGNELQPGEEGEICSWGPMVMLDYWQDPERTAEVFTSDGHFRSGDLGRMDADGYIRVTGRKKELVNRGGVKIAPREIEDILITHPDIADAAVIGMPDERLGERICAFIVPAVGAEPTFEIVTEHVRAQGVAIQKLPERVELIDELPRTATGKVEKFRLRELLEHQLEP